MSPFESHPSNKRTIQYVVALALVLVSSGVIITHVCLLDLNIPQIFTFWLPLAVIGLTIFYVSATFDSSFPILLILIFSITLHLLIPVRMSPGIIWPFDSPFYHMMIRNTVESGYWIFGCGTGLGADYSLFPVSGMFASVLFLVSSIPLLPLIKFLPAFLNPFLLLAFYALLRKVLPLGNRARNLTVLLFALNSEFNAKYSSFNAESFAIIFFPLILMFALGKDGFENVKNNFIFVLILLTVAFTHHFTGYLVALSLVVPTVALYLVARKLLIKVHIGLLSILMPMAWLTLMALPVLKAHVNMIQLALSNMKFIPRSTGYVTTEVNVYYPSSLAVQLTQISQVFLVVLVLIGLSTVVGSQFKTKRLIKGRSVSGWKSPYSYFIVLLFFISSLEFLFLFGINWLSAGGGKFADMRTRLTVFFFFPVAIFGALGIYAIINQLQRLKHMAKHALLLLLVAVLFLILVSPQIFQTFPRCVYDSSYTSKISDDLTSSSGGFHLGQWIGQNLDPSTQYQFAGSRRLARYVMAYGSQGKWVDEAIELSSYQEKDQIDFYVLTNKNIELPDHLGFKLNSTDSQFLDAQFNVLYNSGSTTLYGKKTPR